MTKTNLKNIVRKRRAKTGESYQKALEAVRGQPDEKSSPVCDIAFCDIASLHEGPHRCSLGAGPRKNPYKDVVYGPDDKRGDPYTYLGPMIIGERYHGNDSFGDTHMRGDAELFVVPNLHLDATKLDGIDYISSPLRWYVELGSPITRDRLHATLARMRMYGCQRVQIMWDNHCYIGVIGWAKARRCPVCGLIEGPLGKHHCVRSVEIVGHGESREIAVIERDYQGNALEMAPVKNSERAWLDLQLPNGHTIKAQVAPEDYKSFMEAVRTEGSRTLEVLGRHPSLLVEPPSSIMGVPSDHRLNVVFEMGPASEGAWRSPSEVASSFPYGVRLHIILDGRPIEMVSSVEMRASMNGPFPTMIVRLAEWMTEEQAQCSSPDFRDLVVSCIKALRRFPFVTVESPFLRA